MAAAPVDADLTNSFGANRADVVILFLHPKRFDSAHIAVGRNVMLRKIIVQDPAQPLVVNGMLVQSETDAPNHR